MRCGARWVPSPSLRAARSWFPLILLAPLGLAALASARVTLGRGRAGLSPPFHPCWHCHPATSRGDGMCPVPARASLPPCRPPCVCRGIRFCAILNNSIFIGSTKTYHPLPAHLHLSVPPSPLPRGSLPSVPFPCPCPWHSSASLPPEKPGPCPCDAQPARGEGCGAVGAGWGHPGDTPGVGRGGGPSWAPRWGQTKGKAWPCPALAWSPPAPGGGFLYFISVVSRSQSPARPCTTWKRPLKTSPWLWFFFRAASMCLERGWGHGRVPPSCIASIAPPWVLLQAVPPCPWGSSGSRALWLY